MKSLIATICILSLVGMVVGVAVKAADTGTVTATVTVQSISVSVSDGTVAYGILVVSTSKDTTSVASGGLDDTQVATNNGNVNETLNISGQNSTPGTWALSGAAGSEAYVHAFCKAGTGAPDPCDAAPVYTALTTTYQTLATPVAPLGTQRFDLKITTPTATASFVQQSVNVTIQAVAI